MVHWHTHPPKYHDRDRSESYRRYRRNWEWNRYENELITSVIPVGDFALTNCLQVSGRRPRKHFARRLHWTMMRDLVRINSRLFAKSGYRIALIARNPENLRTLADEINAAGGEVRTCVLRFGCFFLAG